MRMKFDLFTWVVVGIVAVLVIGAVVTVNVSDSRAESVAYLSGDSPSAPVYNAILAAQRGEIAKAREQFSQGVLDGYAAQPGYDPIANAVASFANDQNARRIRILKVETVAPSEVVTDSMTATVAPTGEQAWVTIAEDYFYSGGLLSRNTWSNQRIIRVVNDNGTWKVDDSNLFY